MPSEYLWTWLQKSGCPSLTPSQRVRMNLVAGPCGHNIQGWIGYMILFSGIWLPFQWKSVGWMSIERAENYQENQKKTGGGVECSWLLWVSKEEKPQPATKIQYAPSLGLLLFREHLPRASMRFLMKYFPWKGTDILQKMIREKRWCLMHPSKSLLKKLNKSKRQDTDTWPTNDCVGIC